MMDVTDVVLRDLEDCVKRERGLKVTAYQRIDRLEWVIRQMLDCLPTKRDWLDPAVEREARDLTDARKGGGRCPQ